VVSGEWVSDCEATNGATPYHSPLTTHHSPLTTHHPPLTTHHSPLTTHHSLLTTYSSGVEHLADLLRQRGGSKRFLEKRDLFFQDSVPHHGVVRVARHEQNAHSRVQPLEALGNLPPTHPRQDRKNVV